MIKVSNRLSNVTTYYFANKLAEIDRINRESEVQVLNLGIGSPDIPPHISVLNTAQEALYDQVAHKYQPYKGIGALRQAFVEWYHDYFKVNLDPNSEILPLLGSKEGIMHISMTFLDPGDEVLIPNPGYPSYESCARLAGGIPRFFDLEESMGWRPDLDKLAKQDLSNVKLMWLNYPNMPTGATIDLGFFTKIIDFAKERQILVCHDNPYSLLLNSDPLSIFNVEGAMDCALELVSLSKCYNMAGWRVGAVSGSGTIIAKILQFKSNMDSGMFYPIQKSAITAMKLGKEWINGLNQQYFERRNAAFKIFDYLKLSYSKNICGLFVWAKVPAKCDSMQLSEYLLDRCRVFVTPGDIFGTNGKNYVRISLCSPIEDFESALQRIKDSFDWEDAINFEIKFLK